METMGGHKGLNVSKLGEKGSGNTCTPRGRTNEDIHKEEYV